MRDKKSKFKSVKRVFAATGVKISAKEIDGAVAGMPVLAAASNDIEEIKEEVQKDVQEVLIETDKEGIVIKADSLGSLEAVIVLLKEKGIPIKKATIGNISKKDIADAIANYEKDPLLSVVLGFNVIDECGLCDERVKIIINEVIYRLIEEFEKYQIEKKKKLEEAELAGLIRPCKLQIMKGYVFRQNNPAVVGVDVLAGTAHVGCPLMKEDGKEITEIKSLQVDQENVEKAERGKQVAVSMDHVTVGRQIHEGEILISAVPEEHFRKLKEFKKHLSQEEKLILKEIAVIKRKQNSVWGI